MAGQAQSMAASANFAAIGRVDAARPPTVFQYGMALALLLGVASALEWAPAATRSWLHGVFATLFCTSVWLRVAAVAVQPTARSSDIAVIDGQDAPAYTVIVALYQEALMAPQLLQALQALDYPRDRLQVLLALEADDVATRVAIRRASPPSWVQVVIAPLDGPRTKPRACNAALEQATGELVVIFDAEDQPHPLQLREAAARFARADARLACLQAPLRILPERGFLRRQFALEYALLFEVMLPALARLNIPFPLGGTSNHFRMAALHAVGGWDAYNVTEDADIGLRLGRKGYRMGVLHHPTLEAAPATMAVWVRQRARWIKGHMQTYGVHMRGPTLGGWRSMVGLQLILGLNIVSSVLHGPLILGVAACFLIALIDLARPGLSAFDATLLVGGWVLVTGATTVASRRAGLRMSVDDAVGALAYWPLQSLAAMFALWQLVACPYQWEKTPHEPVVAAPVDGLRKAA